MKDRGTGPVSARVVASTDGAALQGFVAEHADAGAQINMAVRGVKWPGTAKLVVSLLAMHKGEWESPRMLDDQPTDMINAFFEEGEAEGNPGKMAENVRTMYQESIFRGDGFLLTHEAADALIQRDRACQDVIRSIIKGRDPNSNLSQVPGRSPIDFFDMTEAQASKYPEPYSIVSSLVKPVRLALDDKTSINRDHRKRWWQYAFVRESLYNKIRHLPQCFATARTTKHLSFSSMPTNYVFSDAIYVFTTDRWDIFSVVQSPSRGLGSQVQRLAETGSALFSVQVLRHVHLPLRALEHG